MAHDVVIAGGGFGGLYAARRLESVSKRTAVLATGERIQVRSVCWTAGVTPPAVVPELGLPLAYGRIEVDSHIRVTGRENVWAIGDSAAVPDSAQRRRAPSPPTAQHAIRHGRVVAENVAESSAP